ncbi:hypothetical protein KXW38_000320, partial [Aspergillus fumigatus]
ETRNAERFAESLGGAEDATHRFGREIVPQAHAGVRASSLLVLLVAGVVEQHRDVHDAIAALAQNADFVVAVDQGRGLEERRGHFEDALRAAFGFLVERAVDEVVGAGCLKFSAIPPDVWIVPFTGHDREDSDHVGLDLRVDIPEVDQVEASVSAGVPPSEQE